MAITFQAYATNSGAYKMNRLMPAGSPAGIIVHSTGANNPYLKRYVNAPDTCGENPYKNYFDRPDSDVCPHGVIGLDKNGEVKAAKILPGTSVAGVVGMELRVATTITLHTYRLRFVRTV